jgi:hypothetical protein
MFYEHQQCDVKTSAQEAIAAWESTATLIRDAEDQATLAEWEA